MPEKRKYLKPVAWLGGRDLLANLKYFLLFAAFKGKLDPRDWMKAETFPPKDKDDKDRNFFDRFIETNHAGEQEFWFDYFADSGDGMTAGYAIGYLCMSDLHVRLPSNWNSLPPHERRRAIDADVVLAEVRSHLAAKHKPSTISRDYRHRLPGDIIEQLEKNKNVDEIIKSIEEVAVGVVSVSTRQDPAPADCLTLPRGAFLFVGGDTAYHVADFAGLGLRFQKVFDWAFEDLKEHLTVAEAREMWQEPKRRPIFGVPGNHDYYDMIDGFNRQFARSITRETRFINLNRRNLPPQLRLWPFKRFQTASYVAIRLPFEWWFWGVDSELNRVDLRQQEYFKRSYALSLEGMKLQELHDEIEKNLTEELGRPPTPDERERRFPRLYQKDIGNIWKMPAKLIVATSEPTTVGGRRARDNENTQDKTPRAFSFMDLTRPFLYLEGSRDPERENARKEYRKEAHEFRDREKRSQLNNFQCRLDISGDTHHYARYWGDDSLGASSAAATAENYASVVSGGGGASMSPTQTDHNEVEEQALYPNKEVSKRIINKRLFNPWVVITGGNVWLAGLIIAMIIVFGASFPKSHYKFTSSMVDELPFVSAPHLTNLHDLLGTVGNVIKLSLLLLLSMVAVIGAGGYMSWLFERLTKTHDWGRDKLLDLQLAEKNDHDKEKLYKDFLHDIETQKNAGVSTVKLVSFWLVSVLSLLASGLLWALELIAYGSWRPSRLIYVLVFMVLLAVAGVCIWRVYRHSKKRLKDFTDFTKTNQGSDERQVAGVRQFTVTPSHDYIPFWTLLIVGVGNFCLVVWEFKHTRRFGALSLFGNSTLILFSVFVAGAAAIVAMYYSKWLFEQSYRIMVNAYSYIPATVLTGSAIAFLGAAIWLFAKQQGRFIIADNLYLLALLAVPIGCIVLAMLVGNHLATWPRRIVFFLLGFWHGLLQLVVPFLLVWLGNGWALLAALITVVLVAVLSITLVTQLKLKHVKLLINRGVLPLLWIIYGAWMIALPFLMPKATPGLWFYDPHPLRSVSMACLLAGLIGALMSCVWLGWYFAVSLVFDGHANEAGSTARTEEYKQFIRFRITKDTLTGFVIGVDFPHAPKEGEVLRKDGSTLKPRLIDVFTLKCGPPPEPS